MTLQTIIDTKLSTCDINKIANELGYHSPERFSSRIQKIIDSSILSIDKGNYDFNSGTSEFIRKLCDALKIPSLLYDKVINDIEEDLRAQTSKFQPTIFVETNFHRNNEPVFLLAALESKRHLKIDHEIAKLPLNQQLSHIQELIIDHYKLNPTIHIWGDVKQYVYFHSDSMVLVFSTSGELNDAVSEYSHSIATLSL